MRDSSRISWLLVGGLLSACLPVPIVRVPANVDPRAPGDPTARAETIVAAALRAEAGAPARELVLSFDGSDSGPLERSNVYKLHEMTVAEGRPDVLSFYVEGVGVGIKPIGSATGWGIDYRVEQAYAFLLEHHRVGDRIHVFGFSRGAFAARILAAMLYFGGLPEEPDAVCPRSEPDLGEGDGASARRSCLLMVSERIYDAYKGKKRPEERIEDIRRALDDLGLRFSRPARVATLGLWDTVEALGFVDTWEAILVELGVDVPRDPGERNRRYGDQLCNVDRALHALSIDDNRANVYTPKLLTLPHLFRNCESTDPSRDSGDFSRVEEVWFSGAHADVGGGYVDCERRPGCMSNISLRWMAQRLVREQSGVLHDEVLLAADVLSETHDGEGGSVLYKRVQRDLRELVKGSAYNGGKPRIHCTVIERLAQRKPRCHEYGWGFPRVGCAGRVGDGAPAAPGFRRDECFQESEHGYEYVGSRSPGQACGDEALVPDVPGCWFSVVR
jgi:uncharacterized protein (DUF2235 family)